MTRITADQFELEYGTGDLNPKWFELTKPDDSKSVSLVGKTTKNWKEVAKRFFKNKWNVIFLTVFFAIVMLCIIAPLVSPFSATNPINNYVAEDIKFANPSWVAGHNQISTTWNYAQYQSYLNQIAAGTLDYHIISATTDSLGNVHVVYSRGALDGYNLLLGTDEIGRDIWTKLWVGTAWSLKLAFVVATIETIIGVSVGLYLGFNVGKSLDTLVLRIIEVFSSVPTLIWLILFSLVIGTSFWSIALVLILVGWVGPVYSTRMFTIKVKDEEYIKAAKVAGLSETKIVFKHVLPAISGRLVVGFVHRIPSVIFFESSLVFLGMTVGQDGISLGNIINDSRTYIMDQPWDVGAASAVILIITISLQIIANGLRDALDPKVGA